MKKKCFAILFLLLNFTVGEAMEKNAKIYVAGHNGLVGSAIVRRLQQAGYTNLIFKGHRELDLRNQQQVDAFFEAERPNYVFLAAARVGGIKANLDYPAQFIYDNLMIECNIIHAAYKYGVTKLLFLGSSCIYPRECPQPIKEEYLMTGPLELTNEPYALAKIAGINLCESYNRQYATRFISCMPTNLYGPNDNFDLQTSHVLPALLSKIYQAHIEGKSEVVVWGSGTPRREFLHVDDLADALLFLMNNYEKDDHVNIGVGYDISILELAELIAKTVGYQGKIILDRSKPDGTPQKLLNVDRLNALGWKAKISLEEGIEKTFHWYTQNVASPNKTKHENRPT